MKHEYNVTYEICLIFCVFLVSSQHFALLISSLSSFKKKTDFIFSSNNLQANLPRKLHVPSRQVYKYGGIHDPM
jgi:hypothetical protein